MKHSVRVMRWESTADTSRCGIEIADLTPGPGRMEAELDRVLGSLGNAVQPMFVLARFRRGAPEEVAAAISGASELLFNARVCVAVDQNTLRLIDRARLGNKNLGIVLDQVDASTPLSSVGGELVDAVRFDDDFVRQASTDLRSSCVIEAMLKLAHDLGLATLASAPLAKNEPKFDYVLTPAART